MTDRAPVVWERGHGRWVLRLGAAHLSVTQYALDPDLWRWRLEVTARNDAPTLEAAQTAALECARRIARELAEACGWEVR